MNTAWKCLSVAEFIDRCNWDSAPSSATARSRQESLANWQRLTTLEFFTLQNWSGRVVANGSTLVEVVFSKTLENSRFWQCFNWSGEREKPAPDRVESILEDTKVAIAAVEEFTLNDLSQLF